MKLNNLRNIILLVFFCSGTAGCSNWLDIKQEGTIEADKMFDDEVGFEEALAGVYSSMGNIYTYGEYMITVPDALAQYWLMPSGTEQLYPMKNFDYKHTNSETCISNIWTYMYKAIANDNLIIQHLGDKKNISNYNIIKGEALGLRAYLHLDLLRLFGPQTKDLSAISIPYRTEFSNQTINLMKTEDVLNTAEKDLLESYTLLKDDPIKTYGRKNSDLTNYNSGIAENFRGIRMNYYAVCGTLARLYMLKGDKAKAAQYAQEVIDANNIFWLVKTSELSNNNLFQGEIIFGEFLGNSILNLISSVLGNTGTSGTDILTVSTGMLQNMFVNSGEGASDDYRYGNNMWGTPTGVEGKTCRKYYWGTESSIASNKPIQQIVPLIRLTEMYDIVAEANVETPENGITRNMLDKVRMSRNLPKLSKKNYTSDELMELIVDEARRDFVGEGQMFYMYKRLNHSIMTEGDDIIPNNVVWKLPLPTDETQYNK